MKFNKSMLLLYAVTDRANSDSQTLYKKIKQALDGGVTMVQLREKQLDEKSFTEEAVKVRKLCRSYNVPLIINDNLNVALKSGADGIHVGIEDIPVSEIRKHVSSDFIIGATAKTIEQAQRAEAEGADYLGIGAVFTSPTKKNAVRITNEQLAQIASSVQIPSVAIGGISLDNIESIKCDKISGIAAVSAIFSADDIKTAASMLKEKAEKAVR